MTDDDHPGHGVRRRRQQTLAAFLLAGLGVVFVLALLSVFTPEPTEEVLAQATLAVLLAVPLVRVAWLAVRWFRLGDRRFSLVAVALLAVAALAVVV